jgi:hypothetical protein
MSFFALFAALLLFLPGEPDESVLRERALLVKASLRVWLRLRWEDDFFAFVFRF